MIGKIPEIYGERRTAHGVDDAVQGLVEFGVYIRANINVLYLNEESTDLLARD